jgi:hypothetical protein
MQWLSTNADEHLLVDDAGRRTEYLVRRDPVTGCFTAWDGARKLRQHMALLGLLRECEALYAAERGEGAKHINFRSRGKREAKA